MENSTGTLKTQNVNLHRSLDNLPDSLKSGAVTIGNFDGVHAGHATIINRLRHHADRHNGPAIVFTFDPHPVSLLRPEKAPPTLTWIERKAELLQELGVDAVVAYPTDKALLDLSAEQFFEKILVHSMQASAIVEGPNFFFGKNRQGNVKVLRQLCDQHDVDIEILEPVSETDSLVSSSRIRQEIAQGNIAAANQMLTRPYRLRGMVSHGAGRGATIGFPTANIEGIDTTLPYQGVYAAKATVAGDEYVAAVNIGPNPTFGDDQQKVEVHLLDFSKSIYGEILEVDFIDRIRDIISFQSADELIQQLEIDVDRVRTLLF